MNKELYVNVCVNCTYTNHKEKKGFPAICPRMNFPCFAIEPRFLFDDELNKKLLSSMDHCRVFNEYIDMNFVDEMLKAYEDVLKNGIDITKNPVY